MDCQSHLSSFEDAVTGFSGLNELVLLARQHEQLRQSHYGVMADVGRQIFDALRAGKAIDRDAVGEQHIASDCMLQTSISELEAQMRVMGLQLRLRLIDALTKIIGSDAFATMQDQQFMFLVSFIAYEYNLPTVLVLYISRNAE